MHALQTLIPQPYLGPVTPSLSRSVHSTDRSAGASTCTVLPLTTKLYLGTRSPSAGAADVARVEPVPVGNGVKSTGKMIGKLRTVRPVARAYAFATAPTAAGSPSSPAPPGSPVVDGTTKTFTSRGESACWA